MDRNSGLVRLPFHLTVALRKESVDRNRAAMLLSGPPLQSLSARRAWIEIRTSTGQSGSWAVALRKESVDRNSHLHDVTLEIIVALRKESVDRNHQLRRWRSHIGRSLSARRAWIEMCPAKGKKRHNKVALRKESVDRNRLQLAQMLAAITSLSARRAWIEMVCARRRFAAWTGVSLSARRAWIEMRHGLGFCAICTVALRKESVDRN